MRQHLSYANVMATAAVFIALGGSSYAAIKITGKNVKNGSLTGADIKNSTLGGSDIRAGAIKSGDVANGSLLQQDFAAGQLPTGPQGPRGDTGPQGAQGPTGEQGIQGVPGTLRNVVVRNVLVDVPPGDTRGGTPACEAGEIVVGGWRDRWLTTAPHDHGVEADHQHRVRRKPGQWRGDGRMAGNGDELDRLGQHDGRLGVLRATVTP
jgi:hypothetical protein